MDAFKSVLIWGGVLALLLIWLPLIAIQRLFDRDPARYKTGRLFRKLGKAISRINPNWNLTITGKTDIDDRRPYVIVCNHLSQADIPLISNIPWEMKWVAKKELFDVPLLGWMMKMAGDIAVDRRSRNRKEMTFREARHYLEQNCSVIFFPEGTRSRTGKLNRFARGAFELAVTENVPILPLVIDGTQNCLPKKSWKFGTARHIKLKVLEPISTKKLEVNDLEKLTDEVRFVILSQLSEWRKKPIAEIDGLARN
ncbi:MAG: 1-acyl-sn-glycerol-3-phosphate acyltransferase [Balneolaceae bacterium]|nr:1-acyl-sn-glycerol-3-phosphate acyltransferase [Balneolaceae bacterium]